MEDGQVRNLAYHNGRLNRTRRDFFGDVPAVDLSSVVRASGREGRVRCRVVYAEQLVSVEYFAYRVRPIRSLKMVVADGVDYHYKYADRTALDSLLMQRGTADDVLLVQDGLLTDTFFTNIALWDGRNWLTPARPLLEGTKRRFLLDRGFLVLADIPAADVASYQRICLFNAMLHFGEVVLPCERILR